MANSPGNDGHTELELSSSEQFGAISDSVGAKRLAQALGISPRQVNRILSGAQPNPIERFILCLQAVEPAVGDQALDFVCREMGGHFVRHVSADQSITEAVRECAEAIAVMSDGNLTEPDIKEIREAISALSSVLLEVNRKSS